MRIRTNLARLLSPTIVALCLPLAGANLPANTPGPSGESLPTAAAIVEQLQRANRQRDERLAGYQVSRRYHLENELYEHDVSMEVDVAFQAPAQLTFEVRSRQGSGFLAKQVFGRMMEGEQESLQAETKRRSALSPENYEFQLLGEETLDGRSSYKLAITPRREDKFLLDGTVWIDAQDYAVVRAQGSPGKRPSFWTRSIELTRTFKKVGPFWLPDRTDGEVEVLLFGTTWTTIENGDYRVELNTGSKTRPE